MNLLNFIRSAKLISLEAQMRCDPTQPYQLLIIFLSARLPQKPTFPPRISRFFFLVPLNQEFNTGNFCLPPKIQGVFP
jgi:hypothetical protein